MKASQTNELQQKAEGDRKTNEWWIGRQGEKRMNKKKNSVIGSSLTWFVPLWTIKKKHPMETTMWETYWERTEVRKKSRMEFPAS